MFVSSCQLTSLGSLGGSDHWQTSVPSVSSVPSVWQASVWKASSDRVAVVGEGIEGIEGGHTVREGSGESSDRGGQRSWSWDGVDWSWSLLGSQTSSSRGVKSSQKLSLGSSDVLGVGQVRQGDLFSLEVVVDRSQGSVATSRSRIKGCLEFRLSGRDLWSVLQWKAAGHGQERGQHLGGKNRENHRGRSDWTVMLTSLYIVVRCGEVCGIQRIFRVTGVSPPGWDIYSWSATIELVTTRVEGEGRRREEKHGLCLHILSDNIQ